MGLYDNFYGENLGFPRPAKLYNTIMVGMPIPVN